MSITVNMLLDAIRPFLTDYNGEEYAAVPVKGLRLAQKCGVSPYDGHLYLERDDNGSFICVSGTQKLPVSADASAVDVFNTLNDRLIALMEWNASVRPPLARGCEPSELLALSEEIIGNPIIFVDISFKLLAHTKNKAARTRAYSKTIKRGYVPTDVLELFEAKGFFSVIAAGGGVFRSHPQFETAVKNVYANKKLIGTLLMPCTEKPHTEGLAEQLTVLSEYIAECMSKKTGEAIRNHNYIFENFIAELIDGSDMDGKEYAERLNYVKLPSSGEFYLVKAGVGAREELPGRYFARKAEEAVNGDAFSSVFVYKSDVLILMNLASCPKPGELLAHKLSALSRLLAADKLCCGVSRAFDSLKDVKTAYMQADGALRLGARVAAKKTFSHFGINVRDYSANVYHYAEFAAHHMIEQYTSLFPVESLISPLLKKLMVSDLTENTDHLRILYAFLINERRVTATAKALYMHRNNILYRIGRIQELMGADLSSPNVKNELMLSYCVLELMNPSELKKMAQIQ